MILCCIDQREQSIKDIISESDSVKYEMLESGDILFRNVETEKIICIIERKTIPDLVASIKDGRYKNQKKILLDKYNTTTICYIIEGLFSFCPQDVYIHGISHDTICSCILNTQLRDKINVIQTNNVSETCDVIRHIHTRLCKTPDIYCFDYSKQCDDIIRKDKIYSAHDCYISQLCQIPGVSKKTAIIISTEFPSMKDLLAKIEDNNESIFDNLKTSKGRKISSAVVKNIFKYMKT